MHREPTQNPTQMHTIVETIFYGARIQIKADDGASQPKIKQYNQNKTNECTN